MNDLVREACETSDPKKLQAIPGIGPKLATKILVELTHHIVVDKVTPQNNPLIKKITTQLVSLGYDKHRVTHILNSYPNTLTDETLHECFVRCIHQLK
jgi:Holliday junction resolvasome RuvABC DNA-binding subunit